MVRGGRQAAGSLPGAAGDRMTYRHTMEVEIAGTSVRVDFDYDCSPTYEATGPSYASGGEPAGGGEVEITKATLNIPKPRTIDDFDKVEAPEWLMAIFHADDDLADVLREQVDDEGPDPDEEHDRRRDEE